MTGKRRLLKKIFSPKVILFLILLTAAILRFYKIDQYMTFLGDEGRDVLVVKRMLIDGKFTLLGPITSVGSIYMGPVYYYMMAPFLLLFRFNPVGPAVMVALLSVATDYLVYRIGNDFFHPLAGLVAAFTYSISRLTVIYGRSSWNPNVVPFFAALLIFGLMKALIYKKYNYLILVGMSLGILIQLHYVTFLFFPVILVIFLIFRVKIPLKYYYYSIISFLIAYSPFILFELRHGFVNTLGAWRFLIKNNTTSAATIPASFWQTIKDVTIRIFWRPLVVGSAEVTKLLMGVGAAVLFFAWPDLKKKPAKLSSLSILLVWLIVGILSFGLYRGAVYDYYFGSLFPLPHLFFGIVFYLLWQKKFWAKILSLSFLGFILLYNIIDSPLAIEPNNMLKNTRDIARFVLEKTENKPYNFALIATHNSDHAYRYFLEIWNHSPVTIQSPQEDEKRTTVTGQLLVVCEEKVCQPLGHPLWEIAGFGRAEIVGEWKVSTVKVFRLVPYRGDKNA